jgi:hypothetical protein
MNINLISINNFGLPADIYTTLPPLIFDSDLWEKQGVQFYLNWSFIPNLLVESLFHIYNFSYFFYLIVLIKQVRCEI